MRAGDDWQTLAAAIEQRLRPHGLDVVHPFAVAWFNAAVEPAQRLPDLGRGDALGLLVGNTRALWPPFLAACREDAVLGAAADPIERYVETRLTPVTAALGMRSALRWAHDPPPRLAIQRLADVTGLARLSPVGLNVHPLYGPWLALRAAVVLDAAGPTGAPPATALPCPDCVHTCVPTFERARAVQVGRMGIADTWPLWLAVRDACPVGRAFRYDQAQIRYHYARDRSVLSR
jgi:methylmalonic aciduria homocystinuria type C protein